MPDTTCLMAGIGGIIGNPDKVNRMEEGNYIGMIIKLLDKTPDILILHQPPDNPYDNIPGNEKIRGILEELKPTLVFCGHKHWEQPLTKLRSGTQVLNVDSRAESLQGTCHLGIDGKKE